MSLFTDEVQRVLERMVASMHKENFDAAGGGGGAEHDPADVACSGFMKEMLVCTGKGEGGAGLMPDLSSIA